MSFDVACGSLDGILTMTMTLWKTRRSGEDSHAVRYCQTSCAIHGWLDIGGVPTVSYQQLVGAGAESCPREENVPDFQGFGIFCASARATCCPFASLKVHTIFRTIEKGRGVHESHLASLSMILPARPAPQHLHATGNTQHFKPHICIPRITPFLPWCPPPFLPSPNIAHPTCSRLFTCLWHISSRCYSQKPSLNVLDS